MPEVHVWTVSDLLREAESQGDPDWVFSIKQLGVRAHGRGDGLAVYVNEDLGHPDLGQWRVVSYGGPESQLETRNRPSGGACHSQGYFVHGDDVLTTTLPDIGGQINWRYTLHAIVPSYEQKEKAGA